MPCNVCLVLHGVNPNQCCIQEKKFEDISFSWGTWMVVEASPPPPHVCGPGQSSSGGLGGLAYRMPLWTLLLFY